MDSGSVFEMDVEVIRVVIVSMYLKMIRTSCSAPYGSGTRVSAKALTLVDIKLEYGTSENSTCSGCHPHSGMGPS
ncbi:hypothetical protein AQ610_12915 [Burkholderia humptydooensis]|nr:hypothetical protein AQ610_12915 [Burkholderia humptydooensis]